MAAETYSPEPPTILDLWLASPGAVYTPITPPLNSRHRADTTSKKRKRAMSVPLRTPGSNSFRSESPKRRRAEDFDDVQPEQSASQVGSETLSLNLKTTLTPIASRVSSTQKRSPSPTRETPIILKGAWPPVLTESLSGLQDAPPKHVDSLGDRLAEGVDFGFIPIGLKHMIEHDRDVGHQITKSTDFDRSDSRTIDDLTTLWKNVKKIFVNAHDCKEGSRDENAWCNDVLQPLMQVAMDLYGQDRWWFQSVQSQSINSLYLSTVPGPTPTDLDRRKFVDRKTDFVLSYSHRDPTVASLYKKLGTSNRVSIGHTLDAFTKRTALFSGFEVKAASGSHTEAELQMSIWMAASLRKKQELVQLAQIESASVTLIEPALTIVGHEHSVYYAFPRENPLAGRGGVHILGPDSDRFERLSTNSVRGIFRLLRFYGNMLEYGMDDRVDGYWGGTLKPVLEKLVATYLEAES